jgi:hypothetical protein
VDYSEMWLRMGEEEEDEDAEGRGYGQLEAAL